MKNLAFVAVVCLCAAAFLCTATSAQSDTSKPPAPSPEYFRFDFSLKELENGKLVNTRSYQMMVRTADSVSSIRSGGRVPVTNDKGFQYVDVGVNIDVRHVNHVREELACELTADVTGSVESGGDQPRPSNPPVIRQARWNASVLIAIRKPTVVFMSDDPTSKRQLQLEVTATPIH